MNIRSKLEVAWKETVAADYLTGTIAWESDLQASILSVTMVYPPPRRLIYQGNSPTLSPG